MYVYEEKSRKIVAFYVTGCFSGSSGYRTRIEGGGARSMCSYHLARSCRPSCSCTRATIHGHKEGPRNPAVVSVCNRNARGNRGKRKTRAKNRARLSCAGTNFPLLFCTRFVNPIAAKSLSLSRDYKSLDLCDLRKKRCRYSTWKYVFPLILIEDIRKSLQNFVVKRIFDYC